MSNYVKTTNFSALDNLPSGDPGKLIRGSRYDTEFDNIASAISSKFDSDALATQEQAEGGAGNSTLMTPLRVEQWGAAGRNHIPLNSLATLPALSVLARSANSAGSMAALSAAADGDVLYRNGTSLVFGKIPAASVGSGTFANARISESSVTQHQGAIDHNALTNYSANRHIDHTAVSISAGSGLSGGGTIAATRTLSLDTSHIRNVDHSAVSIQAGSGLSGGGTIAATRTLSLDGNDARNVSHASVSISGGTGLTGGGDLTTNRTLSLDTSHSRNVDHSAVSISAGNGLTGGGTIATTRTLTLGTPSTLTKSTSNGVTTSSHTHNIDSSVWDTATRSTGATAAPGQVHARTSTTTIPTAGAGNWTAVYNNGSSSITISQGSGLTLRLAGTSSTGNRTLAGRGIAVVWYNSASEAVIAGMGVS